MTGGGASSPAPLPGRDAAALRGALDELANQLCLAVDGDFDFGVRASLEDETVEKLSMLINFVLDTARRGMTALREHNTILAELDRAKSTFFSNVSHEFRTPLTLLLGPVEDALAGRHGALDPELMEQLELMRRNARRLLRLVNDLLEFTRVEAGAQAATYEPCDLGTETAELAGAFRSAIEAAGLTFVVDCPALHEPAFVDRSMWERIVLNLLSNALKHTFDGEIRVEVRQEGGQVTLRVRDTGIGIPAGEQRRIFERFHRVPGVRARTHEGTGIGLALVQDVVRLHGGRVEVESTPGKGSVFTVTLPRLEGPAASSSPSGARAAQPSVVRTVLREEAEHWVMGGVGVEPASSPGQERVLVVDDNADMRAYLTRILGARWSVETARDGVEGLELARRTPPDLIVTDIMLPRLDGLGMLRELRRDPRTRPIPVMILSARAGEEAKVRGLDAGADDYIVKPFSARELVSRVQTHLSLALARRQLESERAKADEESRINAALYRLATSLARENDPHVLVQLITDEATSLTGAQFGAFFFNVERPNEGAFRLYTLSGAPQEAFEGFPLPRVTPLFAPTFRGEGIVRLDDVREDPRFGAWGGQPPDHLEVRSYLAVPVVGRQGAVLGGLFFGHAEPGRFADVHERIAAGVAAQAAVALERARLLEDLRESEARAREAERVAVESDRRKDEFLAMLGHELRNPLAPILSSIQLLSWKKDRTPGRELEVLERQAKHLVRLVDDLLDVSRITSGRVPLHKERVELASVVAKAFEIAGSMLSEREHEVSVSVPACGLEVHADPVRLAQVIANLLTNAARYTEPRGRVAVRAMRREGGVALTVTDSGQGISPDLLPRVFDLFVQGERRPDRTAGGLGVGLTVVRRLVELHGGTVSARSGGPGRGSEFLVELPLAAPQDSPATRADDAPAPAARRHGARVLVVDDNVDAAQMLAEALASLGHEVCVAHDGESALRLARVFHATTALLDIGLPGMDGYALAARLNELWRDPAVQLVAVTGYGQASDRERTERAGFARHLVKPVDLHEVAALVDAHARDEG